MHKIDHIFYINLDKRNDRKIRIENEISKIDPNLKKTTRISGIEYNGPFVNNDHRNKGAIGCSLAHIEVLKKCIENNYDNVLILEDDFEFIVDINTFNEYLEHFYTNISDYYMIMLNTGHNSNNFRYSIIDEKINKVILSELCGGNILNKQIFKSLLDDVKYHTNILINTGIRVGNVFDNVIYKYHGNDGKSYTFNNNTFKIAKQIGGFSNIENRILPDLF